MDGVIAVGGDVPPELEADALERVPQALVCHGTTRRVVYTATIFERDVERLRDARRQRPRRWNSTGGHEWSDEVVEAASLFLRERWR